MSTSIPLFYHCVFDKETNTSQYIIGDNIAKRCAIIDPVLDFNINNCKTSTTNADKILSYIEENKLEIDWILDTHIHADHLTSSDYIKKRIGGKTAIGEYVVNVQKHFKGVFNLENLSTDGSQFDRLLKDGDVLKVGSLEIEVLHTPGHTPDSVSYHAKGLGIFIGDTMFLPDSGTARCDFPSGDARGLWKTVQRILSFPPETKLFMCHDYGGTGRDFRWETTVEEQRTSNIHVKTGTTEEQFVEFRINRDSALSSPKLIIPSLQVNMNAGALPPTEKNGTSYFKFPINFFK